jgi:hypothetical protein
MPPLLSFANHFCKKSILDNYRTGVSLERVFEIALDENEYVIPTPLVRFSQQLNAPTVDPHLPLYSGDVGFSSQSRRFSYGNEI